MDYFCVYSFFLFLSSSLFFGLYAWNFIPGSRRGAGGLAGAGGTWYHRAFHLRGEQLHDEGNVRALQRKLPSGPSNQMTTKKKILSLSLLLLFTLFLCVPRCAVIVVVVVIVVIAFPVQVSDEDAAQRLHVPRRHF